MNTHFSCLVPFFIPLGPQFSLGIGWVCKQREADRYARDFQLIKIQISEAVQLLSPGFLCSALHAAKGFTGSRHNMENIGKSLDKQVHQDPTLPFIPLTAFISIFAVHLFVSESHFLSPAQALKAI